MRKRWNIFAEVGVGYMGLSCTSEGSGQDSIFPDFSYAGVKVGVNLAF